MLILLQISGGLRSAQTNENLETEFSAGFQTIVDRQLDGVQTVKTCKNDGRFQAIVKLSKRTLIEQLESGLLSVAKGGYLPDAG